MALFRRRARADATAMHAAVVGVFAGRAFPDALDRGHYPVEGKYWINAAAYGDLWRDTTEEERIQTFDLAKKLGLPESGTHDLLKAQLFQAVDRVKDRRLSRDQLEELEIKVTRGLRARLWNLSDWAVSEARPWIDGWIENARTLDPELEQERDPYEGDSARRFYTEVGMSILQRMHAAAVSLNWLAEEAFFMAWNSLEQIHDCLVIAAPQRFEDELPDKVRMWLLGRADGTVEA